MTVWQVDQRQIFNWQSFDIDPGYSVHFDQKDASYSALNRIWSADPSRISGSLTAKGQVILINQNGIIFQKDAQVNVGSLIASSLNIDDQDFLNPRFFQTLDYQSNAAFSGTSGYVRVDKGATLTTSKGGSIWLFAPSVENGGTIQTDEGQVILAAGQRVYLQAADDPALRGFLVEVDSGGTTTNLGDILATRGNATLMGIAVNQQGRVSATTSVALNGSIKLLARDTKIAGAGFKISASNSSANGRVDGDGVALKDGVVIGADSETSVTPELGSGQTSADSQTFNKSSIEVYGHSIQVLENAQLKVASGDISLTAARSPASETFNDNTATRVSDSHIYFAPGSVVDVSGTQNVALAMESNSIQVDLQSAQLADVPLQHNGFLKGKKVWVDVREIGSDGKIPVANIKGYVDQIARTVDERTTAGGTVKIRSEGDIVLREGARIDVSGGSVRYQDGFVKSTQLTSQGQVFDIATAPADRIYDGFADTFTVTDKKWGVTQSWTPLGTGNGRYETGYVEGKDAGKITLQAFAYGLDGQMVGQRTVGERQQVSGKLPSAATLQIGSSSGRVFTPDVDFVTKTTPLPAAYQYGDALPANLTLSTDALRQGGIGKLLVYSGGRIHVPQDVNVALAEGGELTMVGLNVALDGDITIHGGSVSLTSKQVIDSQTGQAALTGISLGDGAQIDVAGLWVNDLPAVAGSKQSGPLAINGGKVTLTSQTGLDLKAGSVIDVSGGGWLNAAGKFKAGNAGEITLQANRLVNETDPFGELRMDGALLGGALGKGGTLNVIDLSVRIGSGLTTVPGTLALAPGFFGRGGFENYSIDGQSQLEVLAGTVIAPVAESRVLDPGSVQLATGARLDQFSKRQTLPLELRRPVNLTLKASASLGKLLVGVDSVGVGTTVIRTDPGGAIKLSAGQLININGTLEAPAGSITLAQAEGLSASRGSAVDFSDQAGVWLGSKARILATGATRIVTDRFGAQTGSVLAGGNVNITASNGYVMTDSGAEIDVSGASGQVDKLPGTSAYLAQPATIGGDAGQVAISATEGIVLDAVLRGGVAVADAQSGQLSVTIDNKNFPRGVLGASQNYPVGDRTLVITESGYAMPSGVKPGDAIPRSLNGKAYVAADRLRGSGFGALTLSAEDSIEFTSNVNLSGGARSLTLDTPVIGASGAFDVNLAAPYLTLANTRWWRQGTASPTAGAASLSVSADQNLDLSGSINLHGFKTSSFQSDRDIRLIGAASSTDDKNRKGQLASVGDLHFTARQIYPATLSEFELRVQDNPQGVIEFDRAALSDGSLVADIPVLSAGGKLTVQAPTIMQGGVIKAPLGEIVLDTGNGDLDLEANSITSVSLENQLVPFGYVENGKLWKYGLSDAVNPIIDVPPEKRIELKGKNVTVATDAHLNLSGGGDLYAAEFLAGPGGSRDVLTDPTMFAVLPSLGSNVAPADFQYGNGTTIKPGDSVYLSGGAGLAAGFYTLLPAHYALLPRAFAVKLANDGKTVLPGKTTPAIDGSAISAGYRFVAGTGVREAGWSSYVVMPQAVVRNMAEYHDYGANTYFSRPTDDRPIAPRLPQDAGQLILAATASLKLAPKTVEMSTATGGRGGLLDVDAPKIAVVDATGSHTGFLELTADSLSNQGAASILLGGRRTTTADGMSIQVGATEVEVANDASDPKKIKPLSAAELILVGQDRVTVKDGSVILATGEAGSDQPVLHLDSQGALLRVANGAQARVERAAAGAGAGLLTVGAKTKLTGTSLLFDATGNTTIAASAAIDARAVSLASSRIALGTAPAGNGLLLTKALLKQIGSASELTLRSYGSIDLYENASLDLTTRDDGQGKLVERVDSDGKPVLSALTLDTGAIVSHLAAGQKEELVAHQITLRNSGPALPVTGSGQGELTLSAKRIDANTGDLVLQAGDQLIAGFTNVKLNAGTQVVAAGNGKLQSDSGLFKIESPRITARDKVKYTIDAGAGAVSLSQVSVTLPQTASLGAQLTIRGAAIEQLGNIALRGGELMLNATKGDVVLGSGVATDKSITDVSGWVEQFADQTRYYPGGKITLQADQGNVYVKSGATVDVSGASDRNSSGNAGTLSVSASKGVAEFAEGSILGKASGSAASGSFDLDVSSLNFDKAGNNRFIALNRALETGGFKQSRTLRVRSGDVTIPLMQKLDADGNVVKDVNGKDVLLPVSAKDFRLSADKGSITVQGVVDASGKQGGFIGLYAKNDITVDGAKLNVSASEANAKGGRVELFSDSGYLDLKSGEFIATGGAGGRNGAVHLRALRAEKNGNLTGDDAAQVRGLASTFTGVERVVLEAYKAYENVSSIPAGGVTVWRTDADNFMSNMYASTNSNKLDVASNSSLSSIFHLAPGIEARSSGNMTLDADWSLNAWHYDPDTGKVALSNQLVTGKNSAGKELLPGILTLRAAGNLDLNGSLSDGMALVSKGGGTFWTQLQGTRSWSYRLVAGGEVSRPDLSSVQQGVGDLTLAAGKQVRTGTGFIEIAAGRDVALMDEASAIYTAGRSTPTAGYPTLGAPWRYANFPTEGGDIVIRAGNDIVAAPSNQLFTPWLYRVGAFNADGTIINTSRTTWWTSLDDFKQGVGALGGGNVSVVAGNDISNLGVVLPTNARLYGAVNTLPDPANLLVQGGGDLRVTAGGNINSGLFYVAKGTGTVRAGGDLGSAREGGTGQNVYTILGLGEGSFDIVANGNLSLETVVNPTLLPQGSANSIPTVFSTYSADSAIKLSALTGDVLFADHEVGKISKSFSSIKSDTEGALFQFYPGRLEATAFQGDIGVGGRIVLMPSTSGNLNLLAAHSIAFSLTNGTVVLSGANPDLLPTPLHPVTNVDRQQPLYLISTAADDAKMLPATPLHQNTDAELAHLVAREGDIVGDGIGFTATLAKPAWIEAGRDIRDVRLQVENHATGTLSTVRAGRDIVYAENADPATGVVPTNNQRLAVSGPGGLEVLAGRNVDLGGSVGIVSRGNLDVANLPEKGADLYVMAGLGKTADGRVRTPDYQAFSDSYFDNSAAGQQALKDYFENVERQLRLNQSLTDAEVQLQLADYRLSFDSRSLSERALLVFFSELRQGGKQGSAFNYERAYQAIATLFPGDYQGDINLFNSQIKTEAGGDINLLAPGGLVNVGQAKTGNTKLPSEQGIFTVRGGVIRSFSSGDFLVNQSRVFTLQGDDLLLWSTEGNIDAGKGSKTASATPPPRLIYRNNAFVLDTSSVVAGSGIGQLLAREGYKAGEVGLFAPRGEVNAGEAGIRVAGDLLIGALRVVGADNIQVGGLSVGVPVAQSTSLAGLTGGSGLADGSRAGEDPTKSLRNQDGDEQLKRIKNALSGIQASFITVDVVGFGETGASNPEECRGKDGNLDAACASAKKGRI